MASEFNQNKVWYQNKLKEPGVYKIIKLLGKNIKCGKREWEKWNGKKKGKKGREKGRGGPEVKEIFPSRLHFQKKVLGKKSSCMELYTSLTDS